MLAKTDARLAELARAQRATDARLGELARAQRATEKSLKAFIDSLKYVGNGRRNGEFTYRRRGYCARRMANFC